MVRTLGTKVYTEHYGRLHNAKFPCNFGDMSGENRVEGSIEPITTVIIMLIESMSLGDAAGPPDVIAEIIELNGKAGAGEMHSESGIPYDSKECYIVSLYNGKRDAPNKGNFRG